jgi:hypothetical protein
MNRGARPAIALGGPVAAAFLIVMTLERRIPFHRSWQQSREDIGLTGLSAFPMDNLGQLASPFTCRHIERESEAAEPVAIAG